jgi:hypothetical protein
MDFDYRGSTLRVTVATKEIMHEIDFSYGESTEFQDIASKDVENAVIPGKSTFSLTGNGYADNSEGDAKEDIAALYAWRASKESKAIGIADGVTGNIAITATAYLESVEIQSTLNEVVTYSWTMKVTTSTVGATA